MKIFLNRKKCLGVYFTERPELGFCSLTFSRLFPEVKMPATLHIHTTRQHRAGETMVILQRPLPIRKVLVRGDVVRICHSTANFILNHFPNRSIFYIHFTK